MGLTQAQLAERLKMASNSVTRMECGRMIVTPPMELLITYIAREAGVEVAHGQTSRGAVADKAAHRGKARYSVREGGRGQRR
jgi:transcriptional regulator with XRE-family HTH domain